MTREDAVAARREELLTVEEFASIVRQHPQSVYRRIRFHQQPGVVRFGGDVRIDITCAVANWGPLWADVLIHRQGRVATMVSKESFNA